MAAPDNSGYTARLPERPSLVGLLRDCWTLAFFLDAARNRKRIAQENGVLCNWPHPEGKPIGRLCRPEIGPCRNHLETTKYWRESQRESRGGPFSFACISARSALCLLTHKSSVWHDQMIASDGAHVFTFREGVEAVYAQGAETRLLPNSICAGVDRPKLSQSQVAGTSSRSGLEAHN